ncbi:MAG: hypothetical protein Q8P02_02360 [Candidatus Micrarchaeota archaeon]|nr:hypothetical protein [Candidatus Micrarchaeota archaeon]
MRKKAGAKKTPHSMFGILKGMNLLEAHKKFREEERKHEEEQDKYWDEFFRKKGKHGAPK